MKYEWKKQDKELYFRKKHELVQGIQDNGNFPRELFYFKLDIITKTLIKYTRWDM